MYFEFYIDQFFLEHLLTGYLLLAVTASLQKRRVSWKRIAAGSVANALMTTLFICIKLPKWNFFGIIFAGGITFFNLKRNCLMKSMLLLLLVTVCFGGTLEALLAIWKLPFMAATVLAVVLVRCAGRRLERLVKLEGTVTVRLHWKERTETVCGLIDSGNHLTEPLTGKPVSIIDETCARNLLGNDWEGRRGFFLIPYHSIGKEKGWLQGVTIDRMDVAGVTDTAMIKSPVLAIYKGHVSAKGQYQMILHPLHAALEKKK